MDTANEQTGPLTTSEVPAKATRNGSSREQEWGTLRLSHDSTQVWSERMLAALGRGNDARQWRTLIDKVISPKTLALAFASVAEAGLTLHPEKTRVVDATRQGGFEFLGWHFERGMKLPRRKSIQKLKDSVRARTKRNNGHDMCTIIKRVNQITRGWGN